MEQNAVHHHLQNEKTRKVEDGLKDISPSSSTQSSSHIVKKTPHATLRIMCGIFAYMGHNPIKITQTLEVLGMLEKEQEADESTPVGGHGAGIAYLNNKQVFTLTKVGKPARGSPVNSLRQNLPDTAADSILILGHVRLAHPAFQETIRSAQCTQPYKPDCRHNLNLVSAHNGYMENYQQLQTTLHSRHHFESEQVKIIDSEIIPHLYEELLAKTRNPIKAAHALFDQAKGRNTITLLHTSKGQVHLNIIHKAKTRGLTLWTNPNNEVILCSREKPTETVFEKFLKRNSFQRTIHITRNDSMNLEAHFALDTQ